VKICFVNPAAPTTAMNFGFAMDLVGCKFSHIPLGVVTLAALTPRDVDVRVIDENVEPVDLDLDVDVVAISAMLCQRERMLSLADAFRARGRRVVIGGPIADHLLEECQAHADTVFVGEAEYTWPQFLTDLAKGQPQALYRQEGFVDMADSPVPRFDLLRAEAYASGSIQATRGCPYRCSYCDVPVRQGGRPRSKPVRQVLQEVRRLVEVGLLSIFFVDDHFAGHRPYAKELLRGLIDLQAELGGEVRFYTQITLNIAADDELLGLLRDAGFRRFFMGLETPSPERLRGLNKHHNLDLPPAEAISKIQAHGITVWAGIMLGLDGDTEDAFAAQAQFIQESGVTPTLIGLLQALPDTPVFEQAVEHGRLREIAELAGSSALGGVDAAKLTNLSPTDLELDALLAGFSRLVRQVYSPRAYGDRILAAGRRSPGPAQRMRFSRRNLGTLGRMLRYYLLHEDGETRKLLLRVLKDVATGKVRDVEEMVYLLVIYKHLRTFYFRAADEAAATSRVPEAVLV
jgi:radical SAM superfamily enzyme YgiQ (UPF0313 family)